MAEKKSRKIKLSEFDNRIRELIEFFCQSNDPKKRIESVERVIDDYTIPDGPVDYSCGLFSRDWREFWRHERRVTAIWGDCGLIVTTKEHKDFGFNCLHAARKSLIRFVMDSGASPNAQRKLADELIEAAREYLSIRGIELPPPRLGESKQTSRGEKAATTDTQMDEAPEPPPVGADITIKKITVNGEEHDASEESCKIVQCLLDNNAEWLPWRKIQELNGWKGKHRSRMMKPVKELLGDYLVRHSGKGFQIKR